VRVPGRARQRFVALVGLALTTQGAGGAVAQPAVPEPPSVTPPPAPESPPPPPDFSPPAPPLPPAPPPSPAMPLYGDQGTSEIALGLGYSSSAGFLAAGGFRYFVVDGVAPGFEATYVHGGATVGSYGLALASLRVVPVRASSVALVLTGRAGRMFLADHGDGWAAGAGAGVIIALGGGAGLELGYEFLRLLPGSFCADLSTCLLQGPVFGVRFSF